jgi:hypothetical protein
MGGRGRPKCKVFNANRIGYQTSFWKASELRFRECGPAIPDELLVPRDEGQVFFFSVPEFGGAAH